MSDPDVLTELWAYVSIDDDGKESVWPPPDRARGFWSMVVVFDTQHTARLARRAAQELATASGKPVTLVKFTVRETVEVLQPGGKHK
jgi:hypothetical protein